MIIINQDKDKIINFDNIEYIEIVQTYIVENRIHKKAELRIQANTKEEKKLNLGEYEKEERAKEVLQEIINAYLDCNEQNHLAELAYVKNKVFEMPEE